MLAQQLKKSTRRVIVSLVDIYAHTERRLAGLEREGLELERHPANIIRLMAELLSRKGIPYQDHDVSADSLVAQEAVRLTGQNNVPVTVIDGQTVVGFDQPRLEQLIAQVQAASPPKFGAAVADVGRAGRKEVPIIFGAYVGRIRTGSIAEKVGLIVGDVIIQLNNQTISGAADLERFFLGIKQGDKLSIVFIRGTEVKTAEITA